MPQHAYRLCTINAGAFHDEPSQVGTGAPAAFQPHGRPPRRGIVAVLAMIYLVLFSALALGFYAQTNTAAQVSYNDRKSAQAFTAAESGMAFVRYHLNNTTLPSGTQPSQFWSRVTDHFQTLDDSANFAPSGVGISDTTLSLPADPAGYVELNDGATRFRATITKLNETGTLRVLVVGRYGDSTIARALQLDYIPIPNASAIFNYGVASKGKIYTAGASTITGLPLDKGSVLSTSTTDPTPVEIHGKEVSGDISISSTTGAVVYDSNVKIGNTTDAAAIAQYHIHTGVVPPEFPQVDTTQFIAYATNTYSGGNTLTNCVIPANTGTVASPLKFSGATTITGVLVIESPNVIEFGGNTTITGCIVVPNGVATDTTHNSISFTGSVDATGVEESGVSGLDKLTGSFILAPGFGLNFSGSFGTVNGSIVASRITMSGNAGGIIKGTVINTDDQTLSLNGSADIVIASTGTSNFPSGLYFNSHYGPAADTYQEVRP
jgi:hypothetical protein